MNCSKPANFFNADIDRNLKSLGFKANPADSCIYMRVTSARISALIAAELT